MTGADKAPAAAGNGRANDMSDIFFIIGCMRSGTTALARILDTAANAEVGVERAPRLRIASGDRLRGLPVAADRVLRQAREQQIAQTLARGLKFGDKNLAYLPFIPDLLRLWDCRILFLTRDGREATRSAMDWHALKAGNIFISQVDGAAGGPAAPEDDPWDYSRMRPATDDPLYARWPALSRFQKIAWYWTRFNERALTTLTRIPEQRWMHIDMNRCDADVIERIFRFLDLTGFDRQRVETMLAGRINSVAERSKLPDSFPPWPEWPADLRDDFDAMAGPMMQRLGYQRARAEEDSA